MKGKNKNDNFLNNPIPSDPYVMQQRIEKMIAFTLQVLISAVIAFEIAQPPNPYAKHLIVLLSLYIALKYSLVSKAIEAWERCINKLFTFLFKK
jgi:hypothetical protein